MASACRLEKGKDGSKAFAINTQLRYVISDRQPLPSFSGFCILQTLFLA